MIITHPPPPASGRPFAPRHFAEAEEEPVPDYLRELVFGDRNKTECLVETDELQG